MELICDKVAVIFGTQISKLVKGYVSTEVDARLSFDKNSTVKKAKKIIKLYEEAGVDKKRILVKIAATWEGIKAAERFNLYIFFFDFSSLEKYIIPS